MSTPTLPLVETRAAHPEPAADAVVFDNVELVFDRRAVLDRISFRLAHGETKAIFGIAGSGKSTILKLALGLIKPDAAPLCFLGHEFPGMRVPVLFDVGAGA